MESSETPPSIDIVAARGADCQRLSAIAQAAKAHWGYPAAWLEAWRPELTFQPGHLEAWDVFAARCQGTLQGVYALSVDGDRAELEHLWVHPEHMGQGIGRHLWDHAVERARRTDAARLEILSDPNAAGFYARMGAIHVEDRSCPVLAQPRHLPVYVLTLG